MKQISTFSFPVCSAMRHVVLSPKIHSCHGSPLRVGNLIGSGPGLSYAGYKRFCRHRNDQPAQCATGSLSALICRRIILMHHASRVDTDQHGKGCPALRELTRKPWLKRRK